MGYHLDDASYHARRILWGVANFPHVLQFDPYLNYPSGARVPWPPLYDWLLSSAARSFGVALIVADDQAVAVARLLAVAGVVADDVVLPVAGFLTVAGIISYEQERRAVAGVARLITIAGTLPGIDEWSLARFLALAGVVRNLTRLKSFGRREEIGVAIHTGFNNAVADLDIVVGAEANRDTLIQNDIAHKRRIGEPAALKTCKLRQILAGTDT